MPGFHLQSLSAITGTEVNPQQREKSDLTNT
jgi:hypothetical protein